MDKLVHPAIRLHGKHAAEPLPNTLVLSIDGKFSKEFERIIRLKDGGSGQVFKVIDKNNNTFAVKRILLENDNHKESFEREVQILTKLALNCEYVVKIYSYWIESNDFAYTQMECCLDDLNSILEIKAQHFGRDVGKEMNLIEYFISFELLREVTECLNFLHSQKPPILHRDLKPANVLITDERNGRFLKLCDFGLSIYHEKSSHSRNAGSEQFIAPEVRRSRKYNLKADIFSLGITANKIFDTDLEITNELSHTQVILLRNNSQKITQTIKDMQEASPDDRPTCTILLEKLNKINMPLSLIKRFTPVYEFNDQTINFFNKYFLSRIENRLK